MTQTPTQIQTQPGKSFIPQSPAVRSYTCCICSVEIKDHVYQVQDRTIRPVQYAKDGSPIRHDGVHDWHDGVILGPGRKDYCPICYAVLPTIQDLLDDYKRSLPTRST